MNIRLNELTLENTGQWPLSIKLGVVAGFAILIIGLGYWYIIKANLEQYATFRTQEVTLKNDFETKQHQAYNLQTYKNQIQLMKDHFGAMLRQLPAKNEMPGLLEE